LLPQRRLANGSLDLGRESRCVRALDERAGDAVLNNLPDTASLAGNDAEPARIGLKNDIGYAVPVPVSGHISRKDKNVGAVHGRDDLFMRSCAMEGDLVCNPGRLRRHLERWKQRTTTEMIQPIVQARRKQAQGVQQMS
jgi:hypothetical protein